ncbi:putative uncharacterized protein DDB_G0282133 [Chrysoperla carnea]|uniref:putative uncharacterized protein DDB_G0282133 n=1 Tax=Chrysoperla carnea TaxID=189513 RepID=UPI001D0734FE|nr:putative uncharacterized protein DDB_G0282133 [Chrysoperla carnea]
MTVNNSDDNLSCPSSPKNTLTIPNLNTHEDNPSTQDVIQSNTTEVDNNHNNDNKENVQLSTEDNIKNNNMINPLDIETTIKTENERNLQILDNDIENTSDNVNNFQNNSNLDNNNITSSAEQHDMFFQNNCTIINIEESPPDIKNTIIDELNLEFDANLNISTNSLLYTTESDNASSPIQTSTDNIMSSDIISNNSDSPKSFIKNNNETTTSSPKPTTAFVVKNFKTELYEPKVYRNNIVEFTEKKLDYPRDNYQSILDSPPDDDNIPNKSYLKDFCYDNESTTSDYVTDTVLGIFENISVAGVLSDDHKDISELEKTHLTNLLDGFNASCLNESYESSPVHQTDTMRKNTRKLKNRNKSHHGVKTLQSIFRSNDYLSSDISSANSDFNDDPNDLKTTTQSNTKIETFAKTEVQLPNLKIINSVQKTREKSPKLINQDTTSKTQIEKHKEIQQPQKEKDTIEGCTNFVEGFLNSTTETRLNHQISQESECSDENPVELVQYGHTKNTDPIYIDEKKLKENKEKLLERYVRANQNLLNIEGNGDPDFGTPV